MNWVDVSLTSLSMSVDAMTVAAVDGVCYKNLKKYKMVLIAFLFGLFQFLMPVIGYFIGFSFRDKVEKYIPYIAFSLLMLLAIKCFVDFTIERIKTKKGEQELVCKRLTILLIFSQAIATSIDALCIGFVYLDYSIADAMITFTMIGITTFVLSTITIFLGSKIAGRLEKWGSLISGFVFVAIAIKILLEGIL